MHRKTQNSNSNSNWRSDGGYGRNVGREENNWRDRSNDAGSENRRGFFNERRTQTQINRPRRNRNINNNSDNENMHYTGSQKMECIMLEDLLNKDDLEEVMFVLSNEKKGFKDLVQSDKLPPNVIVLIVKLLRKICDSSFDTMKTFLLNTVIDCGFIQTLIQFVSTLAIQSQREKKYNTGFWSDTDSFWINIIYLIRTINNLIPLSSCECNIKLLKALMFNIPNLESTSDIRVSDKIQNDIKNLYDTIEMTSKDVERKKADKAETDVEPYIDPPDDFRNIDIFPNTVEITTQQQVFLRPNIIKGSYIDIKHYLDVQYRLYREDYVLSLRNGICKYLEDGKSKLEEIRIYKNVEFLNRETISAENCYRVQYDLSNKNKSFEFENSKRFMYGSLLCFTRDNFRSIIFGTIVKRDEETLSKGQLIVGFRSDVALPKNLMGRKFLMVESQVFFEPYYQVLTALKRMSMDDFPMERYIIRVQTEVRPPQYYESSVFSLNYDEHVLDVLNEAQREAFKAALSKEFVIIQGPPGTGKTFLGLKIAEVLLGNIDFWYRKTPMLVICYTNHSLDQFLEGLLPVTENVIRLGGQSKNEKISKYNIRNRDHFSDEATRYHRGAVSDCLSTIDRLRNDINKIDEYTSIVDFRVFSNIVENFKGSWFDKATNDNIVNWLFEEGQNGMFRRWNVMAADGQNKAVKPNEEDTLLEIENEENVNPAVEEVLETLVDVRPFKDLTSVQSLSEMKRMLLKENVLVQQSELSEEEKYFHEDQIQTHLYYVENQLEVLKFRLIEGQKMKNRVIRPDLINMRNPYRMPYDLRWQCYFYWLSLYKNNIKQKREILTRNFPKLYSIYKQLQEIEDTQIMKEALVIGMTTTCAARYQSSLQALKIPIVIVEEAAEILESHIIASLTPHCEHLILIGDHQQLKPTTANFKIETKFRLGVSLFERMILNNIEYYTLNIQHRMRPEIANLIRPAIYPVLKDGESVLEREHIKGVEHDLFFIDHKEKEQLCGDSSKKNTHEATFLIQFAKHLILNGYAPDQIVILAAYLGQMFEFQRLRRTYSNILEDVRIAVLDNYQGEESDIILLSLVRNNKENNIGFLKLENRVCVALSRARNGLYIMGNMKLLCDNSEIWPHIHQTLQSQDAIGSHLTLRCVVHKHKITAVSTADDFPKFPEGGCDLLCKTPLGCGHLCTRLCHIKDRGHIDYNCRENCEKILCDNKIHVCHKLCYQECGPCSYLVERHLTCGHVVNIQCHLNPDTYSCTTPVDAMLPCGHKTMSKPCYMDTEKCECYFPCDTRVEPCGHACETNCHFTTDPDHLKNVCKKTCEKSCEGCTADEPHMCSKLCSEECEKCKVPVQKMRSCGHMFKMDCAEDPEHIKCEKPCKKSLACGHKCTKQCHDSCEPCKQKVEKPVPDCNHVIQIECFKPASRDFCKEKCPRLLSCGHQCIKNCNEPCTTACEVIVDCSIPSPCGHTIKKIPCYAKEIHGDNILVENCTEPCDAELTCKHKCVGSCSKCYQGRFHQRCQAKCGVILVCNHECSIPCRDACKPCRKQCEYMCTHSKCKKQCGNPCTPCREECPRKCPHQRCKNKCGQFCSVEPCSKRCPKILKKCGHPCVGFCGDPCPQLCRICNNEELTEIFFGTEDDDDARFVCLLDCGHVMESSGMINWLDQNQNSDNDGEDQKIQPLVCPKCKTVIKKTARYSDYVKQSMNDLKNVKIKFYGEKNEIKSMKNKLIYDLSDIKYPIFLSRLLRAVFASVKDPMINRLSDLKNNCGQQIDKIDLDAIRIKTELMKITLEPLNKAKLPLEESPLLNDHIIQIMKFLGKNIDSITEQEVNDVVLEINRLQRWIQLETLKYKRYLSVPSVNDKVKTIINSLNKYCRYDDNQDKLLQNLLEELKKLIGSSTIFKDIERTQIVRAVGLTQGHWYKCPNGHPYAIGECGRAMQISKCYECGVPIGGSSHRLLADNAVATEMEEAIANMGNYQL